MLLERNSATKFLKGKMPIGAVVLLNQSDTWAFATGNPELWRISYSGEVNSAIIGHFARVIQVDYWRNGNNVADPWSAEATCDLFFRKLGFDANPDARIQMPIYDYSTSPATYKQTVALRLNGGHGWMDMSDSEPDVAIVRYVLSLDIIYPLR